jgi:hypothetical protein
MARMVKPRRQDIERVVDSIALGGLAKIDRLLASGRTPTLQDLGELILMGEVALRALKAVNSSPPDEPPQV